MKNITYHFQLGVTLVELMVTIALIGILASIAIPSYQDAIERNRLKEAIDSFRSDMQFARTEAIKISRNVVVSRSPGESGAWCYGLKENEDPCDCKTAESCTIKTVSGASFSSKISMNGTEIENIIFDFRRGTISDDGETPFEEEQAFLEFNTSKYSTSILVSGTGRITVCTPSGSDGLPGYPVCP